MNAQQLENELWEAADQLRANSKLTAAEYSMPVLGLIFLRPDNRFKTYLPAIEADIPPQVPAAQRETLIKLGFQGKAAIYLPAEARFDRGTATASVVAGLATPAKSGKVTCPDGYEARPQCGAATRIAPSPCARALYAGVGHARIAADHPARHLPPLVGSSRPVHLSSRRRA